MRPGRAEHIPDLNRITDIGHFDIHNFCAQLAQQDHDLLNRRGQGVLGSYRDVALEMAVQCCAQSDAIL